MQYTETQLTKLIEDVEKEFSAHLAKAEDVGAPLAKAEEGDKKPEFKKPEEKEAHAEAKPEEKPEEKQAPEAHAEAKPEAKPEEGHAEGKPDHDYDDEDLSHLHKMYMSMSEGERKVHHDAIMKCASMSKCGDMEGAAPHGDPGKESADSHSHPDVQKSELNAHSKNAPYPKDNAKALDGDKANGGIEGQEPSNSPGAKSPASNANGAKINKSEHDRRNGGKIEAQEPHNSPGAKSPASKADGVQMEKSEQGTEVELLKAEISTSAAKYEELKKNFDAVAAFLTKLVDKKAAPAAKAITSLDVIAKSESTEEVQPLTKSEIDSILGKKAADPTLKKSDRDAINTYYLSDKDIKGISHLLK